MKTLSALFLTTFTLCVFGQPTGQVCFNLPPMPVDPVATRSNLTDKDLQPLLEQANALTLPELEGLSIEEAALAVPEILNKTFTTLFRQAGKQDFANIPNPGDIILVAFQSILNATNGVEIMEKMIEDPDNVVRAFGLIIQNFNLDCMENPNMVYLRVFTVLMSDLLQEPFRDSFVDLFNSTVVEIAIRGNQTEVFVSVLQPLSESLDQAEDVGGALGSLLSFVTQDTVTAALSSALGSSGLILEPVGIAQILSAFFARIQSSFEIDGQEFVSFMNNIFKNILDALM